MAGNRCAPAPPPAPSAAESGALLSTVLSMLAADGRGALAPVLEVVRAACRASAVVLRDPSGDVLALAGDPAAALPLPRSATSAPLVVLAVGGRAVATLAVHAAAHPLPAGLADALALTVGLPGVEPAALLQEVDAERDAFADALHDGPLQSLVAARYAVELAQRGSVPAPAVGAQVQDALAELRERVWRLRPRTGEPLPEVLHALARRADGHLTVSTDDAAAARAPEAVEAFAYRVVVAALDTAGGPLAVRLAAAGDVLLLTLTTPQRSAASRIAAGCAGRAAALGAAVDTSGPAVLLRLPAAPARTLDLPAGTAVRTARQTGTNR